MTPGIDDLATTPAYAAVAITCWWAATVRGSYLLQRNSALAADGTMRDLAECRGRRRSVACKAAHDHLGRPVT